MLTENVGARILNIITESLYDKPIVVFREYVQNSADSFSKIDGEASKEDLSIQIWQKANHLYFLDNGRGIEQNRFESAMIKIASSHKNKEINMGYKGIGRLSGISYCNKLIFINICSYSKCIFQKYVIDGDKYNEVKNDEKYYEMGFSELMNEIGSYDSEIKGSEIDEIQNLLSPRQKMFEKQDTGFLVILEDIKPILKQTIEGSKFFNELGWLLPVKFKDELFQSAACQLFIDLSEAVEGGIVPAKAYDIHFNNIQIERPIGSGALRDYECKSNFGKYAVSFHSFSRDKIAVQRGNDFVGIKIYIDNMLLCDETEIVPMLQRYGLISHTANELVQTVKGLGVMIYITDKVNISSNARRTFIEIADDDSLEFLRLLAEFIETIYSARYALSRFSSAKKLLEEEKDKLEVDRDKLEELRKNANDALRALARAEIVIDSLEYEDDFDFGKLNEIEQKQAVKRKISKEINSKTREYLSQTTTFDYDNAYEDFKIWLLSN
ncbi:MAG: ATP-binding protein [Defluviitaleaceae bacterium]|nr:ATP-binding protein [Defluviitaleaceae bacterium]